MNVHRVGAGPDLVLFHGGMGSWKHWIRNVEPLATRFSVHALDLPSYGASASVPRETTGAAYLDLVRELVAEMFPGTRRYGWPDSPSAGPSPRTWLGVSDRG